jgi:hypothetical protein
MAIKHAKRGTASEGVDGDRERILYLHREWWEANNGLDIPRMARVFPEGDHYLMFNLQGHPYYGIAEKKKLWEFYKNEVEIDLPITRRAASDRPQYGVAGRRADLQGARDRRARCGRKDRRLYPGEDPCTLD